MQTVTVGGPQVRTEGTPRKQSGLDYVRERIDPSGQSAERTAFEQQWLANLGLYAGLKFVQRDGMIFPSTDVSAQQKAYNANLILPKVTTFLARKNSINPRMVVLPRTDQWEDMQASRLAMQAHEHAADVSKFHRRRKRAELWAAITGSGIVKPCWDPDKGDPDRIYHEGGRVNLLAKYDQNLRREYESRGLFTDVYPGEIATHLVEPWQLWQDPNARENGFEACEYVIVRTARPVNSIYNQYGRKVSPSSDALRGAERYRAVLAFMAAGQTGSLPPLYGARMPECAYQDECFTRPDRLYPRGRKIVVIGDEVFEDGDNPYTAIGWPLPFVKIDCFPMPGRFWGLSLVEALRHPQRAYNASRGHSMNHQASAGHAPLVLDKGSGVTPKNYKGFHGLVLEVNPNTKPPVWGQAPNLPSYVAQNAEFAAREMNEISAQVDPASSKLPGQLRSGAAIGAIERLSNMILSASVDSTFEALEDAGSMMLAMIGNYYQTPRLINIFGPGGEIDPRYLRGEDLRGHYRLKVVVQPGELDSTEARDAKILDAVQLRALVPEANPEDRMLVLKGLRFHNADNHVNAILGQENDEERMIAAIIDSGGQAPIPFMPWMDPLIRAKTLEVRLNSRAFWTYPPAVQNALAARWVQFATELEKRAAAAMQQAAAMNGAPAQRGTPSQPAA